MELRAGLVLTGGGALLDGLVEVAEQALQVTVRIGVPQGLGGLTDVVAGPEWACAAGLLLYNKQQQVAAQGKARPRPPRGFFEKLSAPFKELFGSPSAG